MLKNLWAPWRLEYVQHAGPKDPCFLCRAAVPGGEDDRLVLERGRKTFAILNRFPYSNGHLLVAPVRHVGDLGDLSSGERLELLAMAEDFCGRLRKRLHAQGLNLGLNLGAAAGAGLPGHLHLHVVPRWIGDTNFMPILADTKVIAQSLEQVRVLLSNRPRRIPAKRRPRRR